MKSFRWRFSPHFLLISLFFSLLAGEGTPRSAGADPLPDDRALLQGVKRLAAVFDVRVAELDRLLFSLGLVSETWEGVKGQKVSPRFVVTVRGSAVRFFTRGGITPELSRRLSDLREKGVQVQVCSVALRMADLDREEVVPEVTVAGNVLISQIALQRRGYSIVTLN